MRVTLVVKGKINLSEGILLDGSFQVQSYEDCNSVYWPQASIFKE